MRAILLFAGALLLVSVPASGFITGKDLLGWCEGSGETDVQCRFYIIGVADAHAADSGSHGFAKGFCIPPEVKASQLQLVVAKWLKEHNQDLHFSAASLLLAALHQTFPCGETK
ncbi:MAG TPA: Rap1a/Tai family immunity protein [Myxococcota bacterium]|nr:Rap1a/Tai family immunity protein [Myxococcota bacterium]